LGRLRLAVPCLDNGKAYEAKSWHDEKPSTGVTREQGLPFEVIDRSLSLIDRLNIRQAIEFSIAC